MGPVVTGYHGRLNNRQFGVRLSAGPPLARIDIHNDARIMDVEMAS